MRACSVSKSGTCFLACGALVVAASLSSASAQAGLLGDNVTATLSSPNGLLADPTPVSLSDNITVSGAVEISAGPPTNIGGFLLTGADAGGNSVSEFIDFQDTRISLRILAGDTVGITPVTGYAAGARYVFSGLDFSGATIVGVSATGSSSDIANFGSLASWVNLDNPNQISFTLDAIQFVNKNGADFADITINVVAVPEPGSVVLLAAGLAVTVLWARRRRGAHSRSRPVV